MSNWFLILLEPARTVLSELGQFLVNMLLVIVVLIIGWVVAKLVKTLVTKALYTLKLDELAERIDLDSILAKGGLKYSLSELVGIVGYWLTLLVTLVIAVNAVGLTMAADLLNQVILYVPNIIAAIFILILGMFIATLLSNIIKTAASNAGVYQAKLLGKITELVVVVFAIAIALQQLGIAGRIIELTITVVLASIGLALALAFGLGCRDLAEKYISELADKLKNK